MTATQVARRLTLDRTGRRPRERWLPLLLLLPACALLAGLVAYPLGRALWLSVHDVRLLSLGTSSYVGWRQYRVAWADPAFWAATRQTVLWVVGVVGLQLCLGLGGALLLNLPFRGRAFWRGIALIPWATPSVLVAIMWLWLLDANYGLLNDLLRRAGIVHTTMAWFANPATSLPAVMVTAIWQGIPFFAVMLLAALQGIPEELYEAARIDGGGSWATFRTITLPLLLPAILITTMLRTMWTANYMDLILVMTGGGPGVASLTLPVYVYFISYKKLALGEGAAVAVQLAVLLAAAIVIYVRLLARTEIVE